MFDQIPSELRALRQWCCFDIEYDEVKKKESKVPYTPGTDYQASSTNKTTWRSYEEALADVESGARQHLGFCFSSEDEFFFLDLDEDHPEIFEAIDTYAQRSISGAGIHLIGRGSFEGEGKHPKAPAVGLFQTARFCLFTADVVDGRNEIKDVDSDTLQSIHTWLSRDNNPTTANLVELDETTDDAEIVEKLCKTPTFAALWNGEAGDDHSESDHALICALADISKSNEQVRRLFRASALCRPHRANDKYINRSLRKVRGKQEHVAGFFEAESPEVETTEDNEPRSDRSMLDSMPDGMLKDLAEWHWSQAYYPLQECSIAMAFTTAATVVGRNYQTFTLRGLNPWIVLVGITASGKSEFQNGLSKVFNAVSKRNAYGVSAFNKMLSGPMASGEGLEDSLARRKRLNSYFPEFHEYFHNWVAEGAAAHHRSLKNHLLDLHGQCAQGVYLKRRNKARTKDDNEDQEPIEAPCLVISGETTPGEFYGKMGAKDIANGFLQRFIIFDINRASISRRPNQKIRTPIPDDLADALLDLFVKCDVMETTDEFCVVEPSPEALRLLQEFENSTRDTSLDRRETDNNQSGNRAGSKAMQIASIFAVFRNPYSPVISEEEASWAINFIEHCDGNLARRFETGDVGVGQTKQENEIMRVVENVFNMSVAKRKSAGFNVAIARHRDVMPYSWLKKHVVGSAAFSSEKNSVDAFERCLNHLEKEGRLTRIPAAVATEKYGEGAGVLLGINK